MTAFDSSADTPPAGLFFCGTLGPERVNEHWDHLHRFEGPGYRGVNTTVRLTEADSDPSAAPTSCSAWVHVLADGAD